LCCWFCADQKDGIIAIKLQIDFTMKVLQNIISCFNAWMNLMISFSISLLINSKEDQYL